VKSGIVPVLPGCKYFDLSFQEGQMPDWIQYGESDLRRHAQKLKQMLNDTAAPAGAFF
jgi:hypothetical protein